MRRKPIYLTKNEKLVFTLIRHDIKAAFLKEGNSKDTITSVKLSFPERKLSRRLKISQRQCRQSISSLVELGLLELSTYNWKKLVWLTKLGVEYMQLRKS